MDINSRAPYFSASPEHAAPRSSLKSGVSAHGGTGSGSHVALRGRPQAKSSAVKQELLEAQLFQAKSVGQEGTQIFMEHKWVTKLEVVRSLLEASVNAGAVEVKTAAQRRALEEAKLRPLVDAVAENFRATGSHLCAYAVQLVNALKNYHCTEAFITDEVAADLVFNGMSKLVFLCLHEPGFNDFAQPDNCYSTTPPREQYCAMDRAAYAAGREASVHDSINKSLIRFDLPQLAEAFRISIRGESVTKYVRLRVQNTLATTSTAGPYSHRWRDGYSSRCWKRKGFVGPL